MTVEQHLAKLCAIDSPSGGEAEVARYVKDHLATLGVPFKEDDSGKALGGTSGNLYAWIPGTAAKSPKFLLAHLDTVPAAGPVEPVVRDGCMSNRADDILGGDNKAAVAMLLDIVPRLLDHEYAHGGVEIIFTVREEQALRGAKHFDWRQVTAAAGYAFDYPGRCGQLVVEGPTRITMLMTVHGRQAHSGLDPDAGINAIQVMARALANFNQGRDAAGSTVNIGTIAGGSALNVVAGAATVGIDVRASTDERAAEICDELEELLAIECRAFACVASVERTHEYSGYSINASHEAVTAAVEAFAAVGLEAIPTRSMGGSDAHVAVSAGLTCVNMSIGAYNFHSPDEFVDLTELGLSGQALLRLLLGDDSTQSLGR